MRPYAVRERFCPEPWPEKLGGLVRRSRSREFVRSWRTHPTLLTGGLARGNCESFPFRSRDRTATSRWLSLMSGRSWLQPRVNADEVQSDTNPAARPQRLLPTRHEACAEARRNFLARLAQFSRPVALLWDSEPARARHLDADLLTA